MSRLDERYCTYMKTSAIVLSLLLLVLPFSSEAAQPPKANIICELSATSKFVQPGELVTITWRSSKSIVSFGPGNVKIAPFGSMQVNPTQTTIYKFKFVGLGGNEKCGIRIRVAGDEVPA